MRNKPFYIGFLFIFLFACHSASKEKRSVSETPSPQELGYFGNPAFTMKEVNGEMVEDTIFPRIPDFSFTDQNNEEVTQANFEGKIYVADFFFTSCPTICPIMKKELLRVYEKYQENPKVSILSHTIDPVYDNVEVLHNFAERMDVKTPTWYFVTGEKEAIYGMADYYLSYAEKDGGAPGGYVHSGALTLIDSQKHIRGVYDGTSSEDVDRLIKEIEILLREENNRQ